MAVRFSFKTKLFFSLFGKRISSYVAVANAVANGVESGDISLTMRKVNQVIYCSTDLKRFKPMDSTETKHSFGLLGHPIVGTIGRLIPRKGLNYLFLAMPQILESIPDAKFIIVGEGEEENNLILLAKSLGVNENVVFLGTRRDIPTILNCFDVFVLPSVSSEGLPLVILEALASAKPVVSTTVAGIPEVIVNHVNGLLVPPKDVNALAESLVYLLKNPLTAIEMGTAGRLLVDEKFNIARMIKEYETLYRRVGKLNP